MRSKTHFKATVRFRTLARRIVVCVLLGWCAPIGSSLAQSESLDETDTRAIMKANFLFHFAASNEWPTSSKNGNFNVAVIGSERLFEELVDKYAFKMVGAQPLKIHAFDDVESFIGVSNMHLVYCDPGGDALSTLAGALEGKPALLVADSEGALERGAFINFVAVGNRIRYQINADLAREKGVLIGNKIMSWAVTSTP